MNFTTRFGGFAAFKIWRFYLVLFSRYKFGFIGTKKMETKNGLCSCAALNLGRLMLFYEKQLT